ncbi:hypothetical protein Enr10x_39100 [Gimesia panareensis]|uniref:Uncharacterized protein n=1 Tax=Gimesia panareensis TaxID=2527978 RepID=A0A517QAA4_9PLAN|nr:hypothetical protein Enr10x_39100 [Gimesia panareensis]
MTATQVNLGYWFALFQCTPTRLAREPDLEQNTIREERIKVSLYSSRFVLFSENPAVENREIR